MTINACRDWMRHLLRSSTVPLEELLDQPQEISPEHREVLEAVLALPGKYRDVVYLHYYEGYSAVEISGILGRKVNTIYTLLTRARKLLRDQLGGEELG